MVVRRGSVVEDKNPGPSGYLAQGGWRGGSRSGPVEGAGDARSRMGRRFGGGGVIQGCVADMPGSEKSRQEWAGPVSDGRRRVQRPAQFDLRRRALPGRSFVVIDSPKRLIIVDDDQGPRSF